MKLFYLKLEWHSYDHMHPSVSCSSLAKYIKNLVSIFEFIMLTYLKAIEGIGRRTQTYLFNIRILILMSEERKKEKKRHESFSHTLTFLCSKKYKFLAFLLSEASYEY